jgi:hypothetical protein
VRADDFARAVHDRPGLGAQPLGKKPARVAVRDEADVVRVRLVGHGQPAPLGLGAHRGLGRTAEREDRVRQLPGVEHAEHVRLVLGRIDRAMQLAASPTTTATVVAAPAGPVHDPRVVPGTHRVEAERERLVQHRLELDLLVAAQARIRRAPGRVLADEVVDHVRVETLGQIPDVERDADHVGRAPRVPRVLGSAAAAGAGTEGLRVPGQCQMNASHLVPGLYRPSSRDRRVHSAGHRRKYTHASRVRAAATGLDQTISSRTRTVTASAAQAGCRSGTGPRSSGGRCGCASSGRHHRRADARARSACCPVHVR